MQNSADTMADMDKIVSFKFLRDKNGRLFFIERLKQASAYSNRRALVLNRRAPIFFFKAIKQKQIFPNQPRYVDIFV